MSTILFISSFEISFKFVPLPLCPSHAGFPSSPCFLHSPARDCPHSILLFPPCLFRVIPSWLSDLNPNIMFSEKLFLTTSHSDSPSYLPPPHFSESCHSSHNTSCLFSGYCLQLQFYIHPCHYSSYASLSSSDCRLCEGHTPSHHYILPV